MANAQLLRYGSKQDLFESPAALHFRMGRQIYLNNVSVRDILEGMVCGSTGVTNHL
jgi:hypothetical protein